MKKRKIFIPRKDGGVNNAATEQPTAVYPNTEEQFLYDDSKDTVDVNLQKEDDSYYLLPEERINLDTPFIEIDESQDSRGYTEEKSSDEIDIPVDELEQDRHDLQVEKLRRKINVLNSIVRKNKDATIFVQCLDSVFDLEAQFELAWNLVVAKMEYSALTDNSALSLDKAKLDSMYKDLSKVRRVTLLINIVRVFGFHSLEEKLTDILMSNEFGVSVNSNFSERENKIFNKLEKILLDYANRVKDSKI